MTLNAKPCPFCGGSNIKIIYCDEYCCGSEPRWIDCECGITLLLTAKTDKEAIDTWNTRNKDG